jgi:hypothetical protein
LRRRDAGVRHELGQALAGVEHAGLHGRRRHADDGRDLIDRFLVVVNEVDDLAVRRGEALEASAQDRAALARLH